MTALHIFNNFDNFSAGPDRWRHQSVRVRRQLRTPSATTAGLVASPGRQDEIPGEGLDPGGHLAVAWRGTTALGPQAESQEPETSAGFVALKLRNGS